MNRKMQYGNASLQFTSLDLRTHLLRVVARRPLWLLFARGGGVSWDLISGNEKKMREAALGAMPVCN